MKLHLLYLLLIFSIVKSDEILYDNSGYGSQIYGDTSSSTTTSQTNVCGPDLKLCQRIVFQNNGYYGFQKLFQDFSTNNNLFLEFSLYIIPDDPDTLPIISVYISTSPTPTRITLNTIDYVSGNITEQWRNGRIRLTEMGITSTTASFNGVRFVSSVKDTVMYIGGVYLKQTPTSNFPLGYPTPAITNPPGNSGENSTNPSNKSSSSKAGPIVAGVLVPIFIIFLAALAVLFILRKKKKNSKFISKLYEDNSLSRKRQSNQQQQIELNESSSNKSIILNIENVDLQNTTNISTLPTTTKITKPLPNPQNEISITGTIPFSINNSINNNNNNNGSKIMVPSKINLQKLLEPGTNYPMVLYQTINYLIKNGLYEQGILRIAGSTSEVNKFRQQMEQGQPVDFSQASDINSVGDLLKRFLREQEPLINVKKYKSEIDFLIETEDETTKLRFLSIQLSIK
eukprot:gene7993-9835_t